MTRKCSDVEYALERKGFHRENAKHHTMFWLLVKGKKTSIRTRISHGAREIDTWLIGRMAQELRLSKKDFLELIDCHIGYDEYLKRLILEGQVHP